MTPLTFSVKGPSHLPKCNELLLLLLKNKQESPAQMRKSTVLSVTSN